jgi:purine nucleosidase
VRVWIDTDVGTNPDDGAALLLALAHPGIEVVGISTVSGDTALRAAIARAYVPDAAVPIVAGAGEPRDGGPVPRWLGHEGDGPLGDARTTLPGEQLHDAVRAARPDVLVALGPLTNVAALIDERDERAAPPRIVAMAGVSQPVWHRGELVEVDHNTASDPAAAAAVHERAAELLTVPLDVTVQLHLGDRDAAVLAARHPRLGHEVAAWLAATGGVVLHDPLVVLAAIDEEHAAIGLEIVADSPHRRRTTKVDAARAVRRIMTLLAPEPR